MPHLELPKLKPNPEDTKDLCRCRPICKSRRRDWKGKVLKTSAELLIENKPKPECLRRWPKDFIPNAPCGLQKRTKAIKITEKYVQKIPQIIRICQAPVDDTVYTPYLEAAKLAKRVGALDMVKGCCPFCTCGKCCICGKQLYEYPSDETNEDSKRRADMFEFDSRVKNYYMDVRAMYN